MAAPLPAPKVPDLGPDNFVDLEQLGDADLVTLVDYPGIGLGDEFWPTWWGCTELGEAVDDFNELVTIDPGELEPEGMPVHISNAKLKALDQGWVFYSYRKNDPTFPGGKGEESLRLFFYVGKRPSKELVLPVLHFKESHDLLADIGSFEGDATLVTAPYQAMSVGDTVTLLCKLYFGEGDWWEDHTAKLTLEEEHIGKPLTWAMDRSKLQFLPGGFMLMSYSIDYATPTVPTESDEQKVYIVESFARHTLLPPAEIAGYNDGDELDPEMFPKGITAVISAWPGIQVGDAVVLYATGATSFITTTRVDPSTVDRGVLEIKIESEWLSANNGKDINLIYQYARIGQAGTSSALKLTLRKPLILPLPNIPKATGDGEGRGWLLGANLTGGFDVNLPEDAQIGVDDIVQMHLKGHGSIGSWIADPSFGDKNLFKIPQGPIPANLGKRVQVFYKVTPPGKDSKIYDLEIRDVDRGWPTLQALSPSSNARVSLQTATNGVLFRLGSWMYMSVGQRIKIVVEGLLPGGGEETYNLRTGSDEVVTEAEYDLGQVEARLPREFLLKLRLNEQFNVTITASFDGGDTYKLFPRIAPTLTT